MPFSFLSEMGGLSLQPLDSEERNPSVRERCSCNTLETSFIVTFTKARVNALVLNTIKLSEIGNTVNDLFLRNRSNLLGHKQIRGKKKYSPNKITQAMPKQLLSTWFRNEYNTLAPSRKPKQKNYFDLDLELDPSLGFIITKNICLVQNK